MIYSRPDLHSLNARTAAGDIRNCGSGSQAGTAQAGCTVGTGNQGWSTSCSDGIGDGWWCLDGTGAWDGWGAYCTSGTSPETACVAGPSPAGP